MKRIANSRGQTLLELLIVFPVIVGMVLAAVFAAERIRFRLALHWAAQHAARAAAVHGEGEACSAARAAAVQSLAPWGARGVAVECGVVFKDGADYKSAVLKTRAAYKAADHRKPAVPPIDAVAEAVFPVMYAPRE